METLDVDLGSDMYSTLSWDDVTNERRLNMSSGLSHQYTSKHGAGDEIGIAMN